MPSKLGNVQVKKLFHQLFLLSADQQRVFGLLVRSSVTWLPDWLAWSRPTDQPAVVCFFAYLFDFFRIFLKTFFFLELLAPQPLEDAATLLLLLAARPIFVFAFCHLLFAHLAHKVKEDLKAEKRPPQRRDQQSEVGTMNE